MLSTNTGENLQLVFESGPADDRFYTMRSILPVYGIGRAHEVARFAIHPHGQDRFRVPFRLFERGLLSGKPVAAATGHLKNLVRIRSGSSASLSGRGGSFHCLRVRYLNGISNSLQGQKQVCRGRCQVARRVD
jgi:hypothetical protein